MENRDKGPIRTLGVLPLRNSVLFPEAIMPLSVGRPRSLRAVEDAAPELAGLWTAPQFEASVSSPRREMARSLAGASDWGEGVEGLAEHFARHGAGAFGRCQGERAANDGEEG